MHVFCTIVLFQFFLYINCKHSYCTSALVYLNVIPTLFPSFLFFFSYYVFQMVAYTSLFLLLLNNMFLGKMFFPSLSCSMPFFSTQSQESISGIWNIHICILYIEYIQVHCFLLWRRSLSLSVDGLKN